MVKSPPSSTRLKIVPSYDLTQNEARVLTSWLFEPNGYLEMAVNNAGVSAMDALRGAPDLDVPQWIRDNTRGAATDPRDWDECAMVWWLRAHDRVNVPRLDRPLEAASWMATLQGWDVTIGTGLAERGDVLTRNERPAKEMIDVRGNTDGVIPSGTHLIHQQQVISKVTAVLV